MQLLLVIVVIKMLIVQLYVLPLTFSQFKGRGGSPVYLYVSEQETLGSVHKDFGTSIANVAQNLLSKYLWHFDIIISSIKTLDLST